MDKEKVEYEVDVESYNDHGCVVCRDKSSNVVMLPCKHLKICSDCNLKLLAVAISKGLQKYICPYCRKEVEDVMEVFA